jgi:hypothetical protein
MVRVEIDKVTYNHMMPPGTPTTGIAVDVYNASKRQPADVKVSKHMILFQPGGGQMTVNETYLVNNTGKTTWFDPAAGTLPFYLPAAAAGRSRSTPPPRTACPFRLLPPRPRAPIPTRWNFRNQARRNAHRPELRGALYRGRGVCRHDGDEGREHLPDRAQGRDAGGREGLQDLGAEPRTRRTSTA